MKFFLLILALGSAGEEWYLVNSLGQPLRSLNWFQAGDHEWVVRRERKMQGDHLFLYRNGSLQERRERLFYDGGNLRQMTVYRQDLPAEEEFYDPLGKLTKTLTYVQGLVSEELEYTYRENLLVKMTARDAQGVVQYFDDLFRNPDGRLRRVVRTFADGEKSYFQWTYGTGGLVGEWTDAAGRQSLRYYTPEGRLVVKEDFSAGVSLGRQEWSGSADVPVLQETAPGNVRSEAVADARGRLVRRENFQGEIWTSLEVWVWDGDHLVREERTRTGRKEVWTFTRTPEGELESETLEVNGRKDHTLFYSGGSPVKEEIFDALGEKVLETEYADGRKFRETYFRGGEVFRVREFP